MPTKRCLICGQMRPIEDVDITCRECEELELDLLLACYAFVHCYENDYCPTSEIVKNIDPIRGYKVTIIFLKAWIRKNWLDVNEVDSVRVPIAIQDELDDSGFSINQAIKAALVHKKKQRPQFDPGQKRNLTDKEPSNRVGMAYMDRMKDKGR